MGSNLSGYRRYAYPEVTPEYNSEPTFDPQMGFKAPRKERGIIHLLIKWLSNECLNDKNFIFLPFQ